MLGHIDETRMSRKFKIKVRPIPGTKTEDIFHYILPSLARKNTGLRHTSCWCE